MEAFLTSTLVVALAEIGDKTQLLSLLLAARYKRPLPIVAGILVATLANHFVAGALGAWLSSLLEPATLRWIVGGSLLAIAAWTLKPDKFDGEVTESTRYGLFALTCVVFFGPAEPCENGVLGETRSHEESAIQRRADGDDPP